MASTRQHGRTSTDGTGRSLDAGATKQSASISRRHLNSKSRTVCAILVAFLVFTACLVARYNIATVRSLTAAVSALSFTEQLSQSTESPTTVALHGRQNSSRPGSATKTPITDSSEVHEKPAGNQDSISQQEDVLRPPEDTCHLIGYNDADPDNLQINSRFLCVMTPVCFHANNITRSFIRVNYGYDQTQTMPEPTCYSTRADTGERVQQISPERCQQLRRVALSCAHGEGHADAAGHPENNCTGYETIANGELERLDASNRVFWYNGLSVLVPQYEWTNNIFHHGRQLNFIAHVVNHIERFVPETLWKYIMNKSQKPPATRRQLRVLFRLLGYFPFPWHTNMTSVFFSTVFQDRHDDVTVDRKQWYLFPEPSYDLVCLRSAILLGLEGATDAFQFLNDSEVRTSPPLFPSDSLDFKRSVYQALEVQPTALSSVMRPSSDARATPVHGNASSQTSTDAVAPAVREYTAAVVPPKRVGYARREGDIYRQFSELDEQWFRAVLVNESDRRAMDLVELSPSKEQSLKDQVSEVSRIGFLVGVHGANFVNSMFMNSGGALFEIFPQKYVKQFYYAGSNSGLRYSSHEIEKADERDCSKFRPVFCQLLYRDVTINLTESDRAAIRQHVVDGMDYIVRLHELYPSGNMTLRKIGRGTMYEIEGLSFPPSPRAVDQFSHTWGARPVSAEPYKRLTYN